MSGNWHKAVELGLIDQRDEDGRRLFPRHVMELAEGEAVMVRKADGTGTTAKFVKAERNRVTLRPMAMDGPRPYLETAERVELLKADGTAVTAQVWDNRHGVIVLRTLPVESR